MTYIFKCRECGQDLYVDEDNMTDPGKKMPLEIDEEDGEDCNRA